MGGQTEAVLVREAEQPLDIPLEHPFSDGHGFGTKHTVDGAGESLIAGVSVDVVQQEVLSKFANIELDAQILQSWDAEQVQATACLGLIKRQRSARMIPSLSKNLLRERDRVLVLLKTKFSFDEPIHMRMLRSIYFELTRDRVVSATGGHWEVIGFQGSDPRDDVNRFGGIFNVVQLLYFCSAYKGIIRSIFILSQDSYQNFPLCSVSINLTKLVIQRFLDGSLSSLCNKEGVVEALNKLYVAAFVKFYDLWKRNKRTIKDFDNTLKEITKASGKPANLVAFFKKYLDGLKQKNNASNYEFTDMGGSGAKDLRPPSPEAWGVNSAKANKTRTSGKGTYGG